MHVAAARHYRAPKHTSCIIPPMLLCFPSDDVPLDNPPDKRPYIVPLELVRPSHNRATRDSLLVPRSHFSTSRVFRYFVRSRFSERFIREISGIIDWSNNGGITRAPPEWLPWRLPRDAGRCYYASSNSVPVGVAMPLCSPL